MAVKYVYLMTLILMLNRLFKVIHESMKERYGYEGLCL